MVNYQEGIQVLDDCVLNITDLLKEEIMVYIAFDAKKLELIKTLIDCEIVQRFKMSKIMDNQKDEIVLVNLALNFFMALLPVVFFTMIIVDSKFLHQGGGDIGSIFVSFIYWIIQLFVILLSSKAKLASLAGFIFGVLGGISQFSSMHWL